MPKEADKPSILDLLAQATQQDLDDVRAKIQDAERSLASLNQLEKLLDIKVNGKPERKKPGPKTTTSPAPSSDAMHDRRMKVAAFLMANGPKGMQKVSESTGIAKIGKGCLSQVIDHAWFENRDGLIALSQKGFMEHKAALQED